MILRKVEALNEGDFVIIDKTMYKVLFTEQTENEEDVYTLRLEHKGGRTGITLDLPFDDYVEITINPDPDPT